MGDGNPHGLPKVVICTAPTFSDPYVMKTKLMKKFHGELPEPSLGVVTDRVDCVLTLEGGSAWNGTRDGKWARERLCIRRRGEGREEFRASP